MVQAEKEKEAASQGGDAAKVQDQLPPSAQAPDEDDAMIDELTAMIDCDVDDRVISGFLHSAMAVKVESVEEPEPEQV